MSQPQSTIKKYFRKLLDPRIRGRKRHLLLDIVVIAICATSGANNTQTNAA
jgi:hypothetical protein